MLAMYDWSEGGTIVFEEVAHDIRSGRTGFSTMDNMDVGLNRFIVMKDHLHVFAVANHFVYVSSKIIHCSVRYVNPHREMAEVINVTFTWSKKYFR